MATNRQNLRRLPAAEPDSDPLVQACIDRAVASYAAALTPEDEEELREILEAVIETHPAMAPLMKRLRRLRPTQSEARAKGGRHGGA